MNAVKLLREQLQSSHEVLEGTVGDIDQKGLDFNDVSKANPVGAAYAHAVISEDAVLSGMILQKQPLSSLNSDTGLSEPMPTQSNWDKHDEWSKKVKVNLPKLRAFARKVYEQTDNYLATLKEEDLDRVIDLGNMGKHNLGWVISCFIICHIANLAGEISAIKGVQGLQGYPF